MSKQDLRNYYGLTSEHIGAHPSDAHAFRDTMKEVEITEEEAAALEAEAEAQLHPDHPREHFTELPDGSLELKPKHRPKRNRKETVLYAREDPLTVATNWPAVLPNSAEYSGLHLADAKIDGDGAVLLMAALNALHDAGVALPMIVEGRPGRPVELSADSKMIAWAVRLVLRAAAPALIESLKSIDSDSVKALTKLAVDTQIGTSAAKAAADAEFERMQREGRERRMAEERAAAARKHAEALVAAEQAKEHEARVKAKLAEMEAANV